MVGYNLYLKGREEEDQNGNLIGYEDPHFLYLAYDDRKKAQDAKAILEQVYGKDSIEIDVRCADIDHASSSHMQGLGGE